MLKDIKLGFFLAVKTLLRGNRGSLVMVILIMTVVFINLLFTASLFAGISKAMNQNKIDFQFGESIIEVPAGEKYISQSQEIINYFKDNSLVKSVEGDLAEGVIFINEKKKDGRDDERIPSIVNG